ncbi:MAG: hypothetical protein EXR79_02090 [Myxococcales bacterium]|nr:hypothetical protein [Myxococcales bacterium]
MVCNDPVGKGNLAACAQGARQFLAGLGLLAAAVACGDPVATAKTAPATPDTTDPDGGQDGTEPTDAPAVVDTAAPLDGDAAIEAKGPELTDAPDIQTAPDVGCLTDNQCVGAVPVTGCTVAVCQKGLCILGPKPGTCCDDAPCDDGVQCTKDKCDVATNTCQNAPIAGCCQNQKKYLNVGFEQAPVGVAATYEGFVQSPDPKDASYPNGNVKWQVETRRAHSGTHSLYFGNECGTYDSEMKGALACKESAVSLALYTALKSSEVQIPAGEAALLSFWMWVDTQPVLTQLHWTQTQKGENDCSPKCGIGATCAANANGKTECVKQPQKAGTCKVPCDPGTTCVDVGGGNSACVNESDVMTVRINGAVKPTLTSTEFDKSTKGQWKHFVVNLAEYAGKSVQILWEFKTNTNRNAYEGIYLDDVGIETYCVKKDEKSEGFASCDEKTACPDDKKECSADVCTPFTNLKVQGLCLYDKVANCCAGSIDCDDAKDCTVDACNKAVGKPTGSCSHKPDSNKEQCCKAEKLFGDNFEAGSLAGWATVLSNSQQVLWQLHKSGGTGGGAAMYFGNAAQTNYDDPTIKPNGPKGRVCSVKKVKLTDTAAYNVAKFQLKMETEWSGKKKESYVNPAVVQGQPVEKVDYLNVEVRVAGVVQTVWSSDSVYGTTEGQFLPVTVDLDKFAGKEVELCFYFDAGDSAANAAKGITIDDVQIAVACEKEVCTVAEHCAAECDAVLDTPSCEAGKCVCTKIPGKCKDDASCDDKDSCTDQACKLGKCEYTMKSPTCCAAKTPYQESFDAGVAGAALPTGWKVTGLPGTALNGKPYDQTIKWNITDLKAKSPQFSLYFGNNGTYNAGASAPGGLARSPEVTLPANGTTLLTFALFLSTEWDPNPKDPTKVFKAPPPGIVVDRLRVGLNDPKQADAAKANAWLWDSYAIEGTTAGNWQVVVVAVPDAWKGKTAKLQFEFDAGHDNNNIYEGAYIDNVHLTTVCDVPECVEDKKCVPAVPDVCKKYYCSAQTVANQLSFACKADFKPGPTCCSSSVALAAETFESAKLGAWAGSCNNTLVKWQASPHKYLAGLYEAYMGNQEKQNYADGTSIVVCSLTSPLVTLSSDLKKEAFLQFKAWIDVETNSFEKLRVVATTFAGNQKLTKVIWDKAVAKDMTLAEYKMAIEKKINVSEFKGKGAVSFSFEFDSLDAKKNADFKGVYLDDLTVTEPCL